MAVSGLRKFADGHQEDTIHERRNFGKDFKAFTNAERYSSETRRLSVGQLNMIQSIEVVHNFKYEIEVSEARCDCKEGDGLESALWPASGLAPQS
jgi:hypothetical protein